jgi:hypothetical protein
MSDLRQTVEERKAARTNSDREMRMVIAAEHAADSLEGIRIDLTMISNQLGLLIQSVQTVGLAKR